MRIMARMVARTALSLLLVAAGWGAAPAQAAAARALRQEMAPSAEYSTLVPAVLEIPSMCTTKYSCPGAGPQIYTCNGSHWENTNSNVTFKCEGGLMGVHSVIAKVPSYNFTCGFVQGHTQGQIMVPGPGAMPSDLPIYRREAFNSSGCVMGVKWITRTDTKGGQTPTPTCTMAENGTTEGIDYSATFKFWMC
ncbi:hypothetical protein ABPG75_012320 [Micractinium tetrahymenae]